MKRYFTIWKQLLGRDLKRFRNLEFVIKKCHKIIKKQALIKWSQRSRQLEMACRMELLKREYVQQLYQNSI